MKMLKRKMMKQNQLKSLQGEILFSIHSNSSTLDRHLGICKEDHGPSISTCSAHTIDVRQDRIPSATKLENVQID